MFFFGAFANAVRRVLAMAPARVLAKRTILMSNGWTTYTAGTGVVYYDMNGRSRPNTNEQPTSLIFPKTGLLTQLSLYVSANTRTSDTTVSIRRTALGNAAGTITIPAGATGWFRDTNSVETVIVGQGYDIVGSYNGSGSITIGQVTVSYEANVATTFHTWNQNTATNYAAADSNTVYTAMEGFARNIAFGWETSLVDSETRTITGASGNYTHIHVNVPTNTCNVATTLTLMRNEVATALTLTIPASTNGMFSATGSVPTAPLDRMAWRITSSTRTGAVVFARITVMFESSDGTWDLNSSVVDEADATGANNATNYGSIGGNIAWTNTLEAFNQIKLPFPVSMSKLRVGNFYNAGTGNGGNAPWDFFVAKNGANTALKLTVPAAVASNNQNVHVEAVPQIVDAEFDDLLNYQGYITGGFQPGPKTAGLTFISYEYNRPMRMTQHEVIVLRAGPEPMRLTQHEVLVLRSPT